MSTDEQADDSIPKSPLTPHSPHRRRLVQAGLGVTGVLWTINSRAQMSPMKCVSPSAGVSGSLSSNHDKDVACAGGNSPGYWKTHDGWPCGRDKKFSSVFLSTGLNQVTYGNAFMLELLQGCKFDFANNSIGKHLVATYLNVLAGNITFLNVNSLREIWRQIDAFGYYKPSANVVWTVEETKMYLEGTYHTPDADEPPEEPEGAGDSGKPDKPWKPGKPGKWG